MYVKELSPDTCVVKFSYTREGVKAEWTHTCRPIGNRTARQVADDFASHVGRRLSLIRNGDLPLPPEAETSRKALKAFIMGVQNTVPDKADTETIKQLVEDYCKDRMRDVGRGKLRPSSYDPWRLNVFLEFCERKKKTTKLAVVTAPFLKEYRDEQIDLVKERKEKGKPHGISEDGAKHRLQTVKAMLKWAYKEEKIEVLPRNVAIPDFAKFEKPKSKVKVHSVKQRYRRVLSVKVPEWVGRAWLG